MQVGFRYIKSLALCILFAASAYGQEFCPQELLYGLPVLIRTTAEVDALNSVSRLRERSQHTIRIEDKWEATLNSQWTQSAQIQLRLLKKLSAQSFRDHERLNTYLRQLEKVQPLTETIQDRIRWVTAQIQRVRRERDDFNRDGAFLERRLNFIASQSNGGIGSKIENELQLLDLERFAQIAGLNSRSDLFGEERELKEGNLNRAQIYRRMALLDGKASVDAIHRAIKFRIAHQLPLPGKDAIPQQFLASQDDLRKVANLNRNLSLESLIPRDDVPAQFLSEGLTEVQILNWLQITPAKVQDLNYKKLQWKRDPETQVIEQLAIEFDSHKLYGAADRPGYEIIVMIPAQLIPKELPGLIALSKRTLGTVTLGVSKRTIARVDRLSFEFDGLADALDFGSSLGASGYIPSSERHLPYAMHISSSKKGSLFLRPKNWRERILAPIQESREHCLTVECIRAFIRERGVDPDFWMPMSDVDWVYRSLRAPSPLMSYHSILNPIHFKKDSPSGIFFGSAALQTLNVRGNATQAGKKVPSLDASLNNAFENFGIPIHAQNGQLVFQPQELFKIAPHANSDRPTMQISSASGEYFGFRRSDGILGIFSSRRDRDAGFYTLMDFLRVGGIDLLGHGEVGFAVQTQDQKGGYKTDWVVSGERIEKFKRGNETKYWSNIPEDFRAFTRHNYELNLPSESKGALKKTLDTLDWIRRQVANRTVYVIQSDQPFMYPKVVDQRRVVPKKWNPLGHAPYFFNYFGKDEVPFLIRGPHLDLKLRRMLIEKPQKVKAGGRWVDRNQEPKFSDRPQKFVGFEAAAALCYSRGEHEPLNLELLHEKLDERRTGRATHFRIPRSPDEVLIELMGYSARDRLEGGVPFASARVRQLLIAAAQGVQRHGKKVSVVADVEEGSEITGQPGIFGLLVKLGFEVIHTHRNYDGREGHVMRIAAADLLSNLIRLELDRGR